MNDAKIAFSVTPGDTVYYIKNRDSNIIEYRRVVKSYINEISRKLNRSKKDIGWAVIIDGNRYKVSSLGRLWFLTKADAEDYLKKLNKKV